VFQDKQTKGVVNGENIAIRLAVGLNPLSLRLSPFSKPTPYCTALPFSVQRGNKVDELDKNSVKQ
jgi:hypothetical protein